MKLDALNTHPVGLAGLAMVFVGLFGPVAVQHFAPHASLLTSAAESFGQFLVVAGAGGAWVGRPTIVPASPAQGQAQEVVSTSNPNPKI